MTRGIRFTFFKAQESCHHKIFWLGARRATNFFRKKIRCFFLSAHANCRNLRHACMGGGAAPPGRYFPDGTWSCIPEHAVRSVNFIAEQQYSAPFPYASHAAWRREFQVCSLVCFCAGGLSALHFPEQFFVPPSACCVPHSRHVRDRARAPGWGGWGRAGLSALVPLPVFLSLLVFNFQARRSCRARFSESSEPKGRFGPADRHCRGEPSSQHARQPGSAAAQGPRRCR